MNTFCRTASGVSFGLSGRNPPTRVHLLRLGGEAHGFFGVRDRGRCSGVLRRQHVWLPDQYARDWAREMIGAMTGQLGLLLALVLGALIETIQALGA